MAGFGGAVVETTGRRTTGADRGSHRDGYGRRRRTRSQWTRTAAALLLVVELRNAVVTPIYQAMAPQAHELRERGVSVAGIARLFSVDHHTATKALRWLAER